MKKTILSWQIITEVKEKLRNKTEDAETFINKLYKTYDSSSDIDLIIELSIQYTIAIALFRREFKKAILILNHLLSDYFRINNNNFLYGSVLYRLGIYNHHLGNYLESFKHYNMAIESFNKMETPTKESELLTATCLQNLGILHRLNNFEEFNVKNIEIAKKIYIKHHEYGGISSCYDLYAAYYGNKNNHKKSNLYLQRSLTMVLKTGSEHLLAICYNNLATSYAELGNFEQAFEYHRQSYSIRRKINNPYSIATHHLHLAFTHQLNKEYGKAILHYKKAARFYEKFDYNSQLLDIYKGLYTNYDYLKNYKNSNIYLHKYITISKIVFKFDKASALYNAKLNFSLQEKEKEAHALMLKNKEFEIINEELKQFTYITSHDLKEPIRSLNNYVQLLKRSFNSELTEEQNEFINYISVFTSRIFTLIKDLNQYTQIQEPMDIAKVDLNKLIEVLKQNLVLLITERNVKIKYSKLPEIKAPESHMFDLFLNLVQNGIKYNKSKNPIIKIESVSSKKEHIISISDNGIGIEKTSQSVIFEVFRRLHAKSDYEGTGIGLAICKKITDQNNGRIWVESDGVNGSTFYVSFPA